MAREHVYERSLNDGRVPAGTEQLREMLRDVKQRRQGRGQEGRAIPGVGHVTKGDVLRFFERALPYITLLCVLPLAYALWTVWGPGGRARTEGLLHDVLAELQLLRAEVRALRDAQGDTCAV